MAKDESSPGSIDNYPETTNFQNSTQLHDIVAMNLNFCVLCICPDFLHLFPVSRVSKKGPPTAHVFQHKNWVSRRKSI